MLGVKSPQEKFEVQFEMRLEFRRFSSRVLTWERPGFDRVAAIAVGLGLKQFKPCIYCDDCSIEFRIYSASAATLFIYWAPRGAIFICRKKFN